ncbi:MAG: ATP-dependent sacrificial sulfur transferase LarE [Thermoplasmata archaeon]
MIPTRPGPEPGPRSPTAIADELVRGGRALIALSGGVDSAVVALLAYQALGPNAIAVTLVGPAISQAEIDRAGRSAREIGIDHELVAADPLEVEAYRNNPSNRCYFCRTTETAALREFGQRSSVEQYVDGVHLDDLGDDRPGLIAMAEAGFRHPLVWAAWRKNDVRQFAHQAGLSNWDAPSDACLASRVRHGQLLSAPLLRQIEEAERWIAGFGFRRVRVRVDGGSVRVEVDPEEVGWLRSEPTATAVQHGLSALGFSEIELDPIGYRPRPGA